MPAPRSRAAGIVSSAVGTASCQGSRAGDRGRSPPVCACACALSGGDGVADGTTGTGADGAFEDDGCGTAGTALGIGLASLRLTYVNTVVRAAARVTRPTAALQEWAIAARILCARESGQFGAAARRSLAAAARDTASMASSAASIEAASGNDATTPSHN